MTRIALKSQLASRITESTGVVFLREDFEDLSAYDQVGRALRQLVNDGILASIGYGLYAKATTTASGQQLLLDDPKLVEKASFRRLGVDQDDQGRFSRKITLPAGQPIHAIPGDGSQRLSQRLGLQFPYDWSNSQMKEDVLINKVLEKSRFEDVMRIAFYYGLPRISQSAQQRYQGELPQRLMSILNNIDIGFSAQRPAA